MGYFPPRGDVISSCAREQADVASWYMCVRYTYTQPDITGHARVRRVTSS